MYTLGAQLEGGLTDASARLLVPQRVYHVPLRWDECEKAPGVYVFPQWLYDTQTRLNLALGQGNYQLVIGLKCTPYDYSLPPHHRNSPPSPPNYGKFVTFAEAVCQAFSPYALEIYNEPEFTVLESAKWQEFFGGWGDMGWEYGTLVRILYDYLHTNTDTKFIAGASFGLVNVDRALDFLSQAVEAGMKADYYSWHAYWKYSDVIYGQRDFYQALWFADKAYELFPVPQVISETSVTRDEGRPELPAHRKAQADLLQFYMENMTSTPIESVWWYCLADNPWMKCSMVMGDTVYPAYGVWKGYEG